MPLPVPIRGNRNFAYMTVEERKAAMEQRVARSREVFTRRMSGQQLAKIGEELGLSATQVNADIKLQLKILAEGTPDLKEQRIFEVERLEFMINMLWSQVEAGDFEAIRTVAVLMTRKAKYLGLDAPIKLKHTVEDKRKPSPEELQLRLQGLFEKLRRIGAINPDWTFEQWKNSVRKEEAIDAEVVPERLETNYQE